MTVTTPSDLNPSQTLIYELTIPSPYTPAWWTVQTIQNIPPDAVGWLTAQSWQITSIDYDNTTTPPTPYFTMARQSLQNWTILQSLLDFYAFAYNQALAHNAIRYNDVVANWTGLIDSTYTHLEAQTTEQNAHVVAFLATLDADMTEIATKIAANQTEIVTYTANVTTHLASMDTKLAELETNVSSHTTTIEALLTSQAGYLTTFLTDLDAKLAELDTNYSAHLTLIEALLADGDAALATFTSSQASELVDLKSEYLAHVPTAIAFLDDLGTTELARINEEFAASLSKQQQQLVDRGLYSSGVAADITARNTRDRDEQIQALYDRLMREKLANQHQLYGQGVEMRVRTLEEAARLQQTSQALTTWKTAQRDRLLELVQQIELQQAAGIEKSHAAQQDVSRFATDERNRLLSVLQAAVAAVAAGKERYATLLVQFASTLAEHRHREIIEKMNRSAAILANEDMKHKEDMSLMTYQLDARNQLFIGLYGFVERREDIGPSFEALTQLCVGLGDAGGGWVTP